MHTVLILFAWFYPDIYVACFSVVAWYYFNPLLTGRTIAGNCWSVGVPWGSRVCSNREPKCGVQLGCVATRPLGRNRAETGGSSLVFWLAWSVPRKRNFYPGFKDKKHLPERGQTVFCFFVFLHSVYLFLSAGILAYWKCFYCIKVLLKLCL